MKKILEFFSQKDKQRHMAACLLIVVFCAVFARMLGFSPLESVLMGVAWGVTAGVAKEAADWLLEVGVADLGDLLADGIGVIGGVAVLLGAMLF